ncbi:MAG: CPBP family intramembrane metalloprotease [Deltaproteobacteria bacterium]|nr:CPBP family intramembrane metalloprotease [Deltaproteobacteria bacterium]
MASTGKGALLLEVLAATAALVLLLRLLHHVSWGPIHAYSSVIFLAVAIYGPWLLLRWRGRSVDFLEVSPGAMGRSLWSYLLFSCAIFPAFLVAAHGWQWLVEGRSLASSLVWWPGTPAVVAQIILVALPEEFFFRGYVQSTLDKIFHARWRLFGARLGWSWLLTAGLFALAHSMIFYQWWHFAILFPGLAFGYLRARTNGILASTLFHASANLVMWWVGSNYR